MNRTRAHAAVMMKTTQDLTLRAEWAVLPSTLPLVAALRGGGLRAGVFVLVPE